LPRISALVRKASGESRPQLLAANVDVVFIMTMPDGDLNFPRIERYLALVRESGALPVIVVNKADLTNDALGITRRIAAMAHLLHDPGPFPRAQGPRIHFAIAHSNPIPQGSCFGSPRYFMPPSLAAMSRNCVYA